MQSSRFSSLAGPQQIVSRLEALARLFVTKLLGSHISTAHLMLSSLEKDHFFFLYKCLENE